MNNTTRVRRSTRFLRRAAGGVCAAALLAVATPLVAGASAPSTDQAPTIGAISATGGDVTVTWTNNAPDATSIDAILYDQNGDVLVDDNVSPTTTTDTFTSVADGGGYTIDVIANTSGGALDPGASSPFDIYQGSYVVDQAPTIGNITATGGDCTVTWTNDAPDATSVDVILYDQNGNVVEDDNVSPTTTTDTFINVADGGGYTIDVIANTPGGALDPGATSPFDIYLGAFVVDQAPTIGTITAADGIVTVTWANGAPDATSIDVILYDQNGEVLVDDNVSATTTTNTFANVADGQGYTIDVIANTPGGALDPGGSASFTLAGGSLSFDTGASIESITATGGVITLSWTSNTPDATAFDVILYSSDGSVIEDDTVGASVTFNSFQAVPDGAGFTIGIVAHTPVGEFTTTSDSFNLVDGSIQHVVIDPHPAPTPTIVPSVDVTVTPINDGTGGWAVSWNELASAPTDGYYLVTDDQGDSCTADPTGVAGTLLSCTLAAHADGSTTITGVVVEFEPTILYFAAANGTGPKSTATPTPVAVDTSGSTTKTVTPTSTVTPVVQHRVAAGPIRTGDNALPFELTGVICLALALAALMVVRARRRRVA